MTQARPVPVRGSTEPAGRHAGRWLLAFGVAAALATAVLYAADIANHPLVATLDGFDLRVYRAGGIIARHAPATLYSWQLRPGIKFTYPPFAALVFAAASLLPWPALMTLTTLAGIAALALVVWLAFGALGWHGRQRAGLTLLITAAAFCTEPVQRTLSLGQVNLLLMALIVWDLSDPGTGRRRWWQGAATGLAAGVKLVPLIFIPYLLITRRVRAAAAATAWFACTVVAGFAALPGPSREWWLRGYFLAAGKTGFVGFVGNQSLRGILTRVAGSVAAAKPGWLAAAVAAGAAGLAAAAVLHRAGRPFHGLLVCALTGLLVSPISWDHHWVWVAPGLAVLADAAAHAQGLGRPALGLLTAVTAALFGAWPYLWQRHPALIPPGGLIWYAPGTYFASGDHPWYREYHWHGVQLVAGNLYVLAGIGFLALAVVAAVLALRSPGARARVTGSRPVLAGPAGGSDPGVRR